MRTESVRTIAPFWGGKICGVHVLLNAANRVAKTNAATSADFLNYVGQQTKKNTFTGIIGHLNPFVNANNCNFTLKISDKTMLCGWSFLP